MPIPACKDELVSAITASYSKLVAELADIPTDRADKPEMEGHAKNTRMSVNNLLAYLTGWGHLVLKWHERRSAGMPADFPETGFKWNELGRLARKFYDDYKDDDFPTLRQKLDATTAEILKLIEQKSNAELYETAWYDKWTLGRMIQLNTSSPFKNATQRIRSWKKSSPTPPG